MRGFFQLSRCNVHLEIATEKKRPPTRGIHLRKQEESSSVSQKKQWRGQGRILLKVVTCKLAMAQKMVLKILRKKFNLRPYHLQLMQQIKDDDK
ncbi:hypothetical protein TNCV_3957751 [Trichonephila clavipes]|nr:hypothetical protein TNCV_3957751 [Trichonephila clavipes]